MSSKTVKSENPTSRETGERPNLRTRPNPVLAALGLVPMGDPLPELAGWRQGRGRAA